MINLPTWIFFLVAGIASIYFGIHEIKNDKKKEISSGKNYSTNLFFILLGIVFLIGAFFKIITS
jgi:hypothetical protein